VDAGNSTIRSKGRRPFSTAARGKNYKKAFGPRLGFAYDVLGNSKTVVRGGFGIYYDSTPWEISYIDRTFDGVKYLFGVFQSYPQPDLNDPAFSAPQTPGGFAINGNVHQPYTEQFSIAVSHELPRGIVLDVSYAHFSAYMGG